MKMKGLSTYKTRIHVFILVVTMLAGVLSFPAGAGAATTYNYAEALQKSIYFYDAEKCGPGITGGNLEWRGDCHLADLKVPLKPMGTDTLGTNMSQTFINANKAVLDPDGDGTMDLSGGFHDAGDHVQFGLPQGYAASTLGWGFYDFRDAYVSSGQEQHMLNILKWFSDYFLRCTFRNSAGDVVAFCYQVGEGSVDHTYWGSPELQRNPRPGYFATSETPASDQCAEAAAALAISYLNFKGTDATYAAKCLDASKALYKFAVKYRGLGYSGGFYNSSSDEDDLSWAAVWLNTATGDMTYITDITAVDASGMYTGYLKKIIRSTADNWQNIWVHSWDVVWGGVFAKLAPITNSDRDWYMFRWNLEYWSGVKHVDPSDNNYMAGTPAGYKVIATWGSARYNTAAQLCALAYRKYTGRTDFADWAKGQMDYLLGSNPMNRCYEVGYSDISAKHPHHRAAHGSLTNSMIDPPEHRHTLWGALVGGPDDKDNHVDITTDYVYNEVAVDYNAGFVGALAALYKYYGAGQTPLANFPPKEAAITEYYSQAKLEQENTERSQVTIDLYNQSVHPPHVETGMSARYFFDISELVAAGQTISDVSVALMYDEQATGYSGSTKITGPFQWNGNIYYVQFDWSGNEVYGDRELQFALVAKQDATWKSNWNPANDWSRQGLASSYINTPNIPVYLNGVKVWGTEPGGSTPTPTPSTATPTPTPSTATPTPTPSTATPTPTPSTATPTPTPSTATPTPTPSTATPTPTPSTATPTPTPSTATPTPTPSTATPTPTPSTATPTPTPTGSTPTPGGIKVQFFNGNTAATTNTIYPNFKLVNTGTAAITLSNVKIRYYFTNDGTAALSAACDYATTGSANITSAFTTIAKTNADRYCEVGFTSGAGTLAAGASTEVKLRVWKSDWSNFTQTNDYSFNATATNYVDSTTVTGFLSGALSWGTEP